MTVEDNPYQAPQPSSEVAEVAYKLGYEKGTLLTNRKYWGLQITVWIFTIIHLYCMFYR